MTDATSDWLDAPLIVSDKRLREIIMEVLNEWAAEDPEDMFDFINVRMRGVKEMAAGSGQGKTVGGERVLGAVPGFVAMGLRQVLGLDWWRCKDSALGILFDVFKEGRIFYKKGGGQMKIQLNDADRKARIV